MSVTPRRLLLTAFVLLGVLGHRAGAARSGEAPATPRDRLAALMESLRETQDRMLGIERRLDELERAMDREERGELDRRRARRPKPAPKHEPEKEPSAAEGTVETPAPDAEEPAEEIPAETEDEGIDPAILEVAGTYDLDLDALLEGMEAAMREQLASDLGDVPPEFLEQFLEQFRERMSEFRFELTLATDLTWSAKGVMGGEDQSAAGTWERDGESVTLTQTEENGEEMDEPEVLEGTYEDGVLRLTPPEDQMPVDLVLRKRT